MQVNDHDRETCSACSPSLSGGTGTCGDQEEGPLACPKVFTGIHEDQQGFTVASALDVPSGTPDPCLAPGWAAMRLRFERNRPIRLARYRRRRAARRSAWRAAGGDLAEFRRIMGSGS